MVAGEGLDFVFLRLETQDLPLVFLHLHAEFLNHNGLLGCVLPGHTTRLAEATNGSRSV